MLRLADADMLPYEYSNFADTIGKYVQELTKLTDDMRAGTAETNGWISDKLLADVADPKLVYITPAAKPPVPYLNFAPLQNALASLQKSAADFERARRSAESRDKATLSKAKQAELDQALLQVELKLTGQGLPRRPWYRHVIYAPGFYTGYGVKTLPGIREAIEQRNWPEASEQIQVAAETLQSYSLGLDHCRELLEAH
jgi:N-acetylated-alpha-linked acidic dipeptidase